MNRLAFTIVLNGEHHLKDGHIQNLIPLMQEFYRVCKHGAILDIVAPHHNHEVFYGDPTHVRPITVNSMNLFSKKFNKEDIDKGGSCSSIGLKYNVDFELIEYSFEYDHFYQPLIDNFNLRKSKHEITQEEAFAFERLMREANNVAINTKIKMMVIKSDE